VSSMSLGAHSENLPQVDEKLVRANSHRIQSIASQHRIADLRVASNGQLVGTVPGDADSIDIVDLELAVGKAIGAETYFVSNRVLSKAGVSHQLVDARPLWSPETGQPWHIYLLRCRECYRH
jgi:hypothetical protein